MPRLHFLEAHTEAHFQDMSLLHALGWRTAYRGFIPKDYLDREIRDDRWVPFFHDYCGGGRYQGLILYDGGQPLCRGVYGPARRELQPPGAPDLSQWGELVSLYAHPEHWRCGYGSLLLGEILLRLKKAGYPGCFLYVLRENTRARRFYEKHGFTWDGCSIEDTLPPGTVLTDLRYRKTL